MARQLGSRQVFSSKITLLAQTDWFVEPSFEDPDPDMCDLFIWRHLYHCSAVFYTHLARYQATIVKGECKVCVKEAYLKQFKNTIKET